MCVCFQGHAERFAFLQTICTLQGLDKELAQLFSSGLLKCEGSVMSLHCPAALPPCCLWVLLLLCSADATLKKEAAEAETASVNLTVPFTPVLSFLSRELPALFLDLDDATYADCHTSYSHFQMRIPQFDPENPFPLERSIHELVRLQACLERVRALPPACVHTSRVLRRPCLVVSRLPTCCVQVSMHIANVLGKSLQQFEFERRETPHNIKAYYKALWSHFKVKPDNMNTVVASYKQWAAVFDELMEVDRDTGIYEVLTK